jgi:chloramphenicol O-acetyltransferase type B
MRRLLSNLIWWLADRARLTLGVGGRMRDPVSGRLSGELTAREAVAAGVATLGRHSYGGFQVLAGPGDTAVVRVGSFCSIGNRAAFSLGGNHRSDWASTYPFRAAWGLPGAGTDGHPRPEADTEVGHDVWIGADSLIMPGVKIGTGAVIGARAVVTKDVRPYAIVVGSPAREVRRRFDDETVDALIELAWWEWPDELIRQRVDLLCSPDVGALLAADG